MTEAFDYDGIIPSDLATIQRAVASVTRRLAPRSDWDGVQSDVAWAAVGQWRKGTWSEIHDVGAWAHNVAVRRCADAHHKRLRTWEAWEKLARLRPLGTSSYPEPEASTESVWRQLVSELTYAESRALFLLDRGFTYQEIADYFGVERGTISTTIYRARQRLRGLGPDFL